MKIARSILSLAVLWTFSVLGPGSALVTGQSFQGYGVSATRPSSVLESGRQVNVASRVNPNKKIQFPYKLKAGQRGAAVYSGPSTSFYQTSSVAPGQQVEVYRHDPDGWLAIRPSTDDFSLVRSIDLIGTSSPGVFRVQRQGAKAWIGTRINQKHKPVSQVKLDKGELVAVVSTLAAQRAGKSESWFQIKPPRGEFRWVHQSQFDLQGSQAARTPIATSNRKASTAGSVGQAGTGKPNNLVASFSEKVAPIDFGNESKGLAEEKGSASNSGKDAGALDNPWQAAKQRTAEVISDHTPVAKSLPKPDSTPPTFGETDAFGNQPEPRKEAGQQMLEAAQQWEEAVRRLRGSKGGFYQSETSKTSPTDLDSTAPVTGARSSSAGLIPSGTGQGDLSYRRLLDPKKDWDQQLAGLTIAMNQEILRTPATWNLRPMLQASQHLGSSANTQSQRQKAASVQQRLEQFLVMQSRSQVASSGSTGTRFAAAGNVPGLLAGPKRSGTGRIARKHPYDAVGYLKEMVLDRGNMGRTFVLLDEVGRPICHVMKMPGGVNLRLYLGQKVGVIGIKKYHERLKLPHVTVKRIFPLGD